MGRGDGGGDRLHRDIDRVARGGRNHEPVGGAVVCADDLRDAPAVVPQQCVGGAHDAARAAVVDLQRVLAGAGEQLGEVDQPGRVGAVVAVDGLVVVAHTEHRGVGSGQQAHQQQVRRCEVLELVDQQQPARPLCGGAGLRVAQQQLDGLEDLFVVVDVAGTGQLVPVAGEGIGKPFDLAVVAALHLRRVEQPEASDRQRFDPGGDGIGVADARELDQPADEPAHFGLVDRVEALRLASERCAAVDDRERDGVERAHLQAGHVGGAGGDLFLGPLVERDERDGGGRDAPLLHQVTRAFGEHPGLTRAGGGDDAGRATVVGDCGQLVGGERSLRAVAQRWAQRPVLDRHSVQHRGAVDRGCVARRPTVEPRSRTVGQFDVAAPVGDGASAGTHCQGQQRPVRRGSRIDGVAEHQVLQLVAAEPHPRPHRVRWQRGGERRGQLLAGGVADLEHAPRALGGRLQQQPHQVAGRGLDDHPRCVLPLGGGGLAGGDDDVATQDGRPDDDAGGDRLVAGRRIGLALGIGLALARRLGLALVRSERYRLVVAGDLLAVVALPAGLQLVGSGVRTAAVHARQPAAARGIVERQSHQADLRASSTVAQRSGSLLYGA